MELEKSGALLESGTYEGKHSSTAEFIFLLWVKYTGIPAYQCIIIWFESFNKVTVEAYFLKKM